MQVKLVFIIFGDGNRFLHYCFASFPSQSDVVDRILLDVESSGETDSPIDLGHMRELAESIGLMPWPTPEDQGEERIESPIFSDGGEEGEEIGQISIQTKEVFDGTLVDPA